MAARVGGFPQGCCSHAAAVLSPRVALDSVLIAFHVRDGNETWRCDSGTPEIKINMATGGGECLVDTPEGLVLMEEGSGSRYWLLMARICTLPTYLSNLGIAGNPVGVTLNQCWFYKRLQVILAKSRWLRIQSVNRVFGLTIKILASFLHWFSARVRQDAAVGVFQELTIGRF
jgi:hypothetical protein